MGKNAHPPRNTSTPKKSVDNSSDSTSKKPVKSDKADKGANARSAENEPAKGKGKSKKPEESAPQDEAAKKPTVKQMIGGASWTGKLPVNMLSELCQKEKWQKPEYTMSKAGEAFWSTVILSKKNLKTQEVTTLAPFRLPPEHKQLANQPSALEARHFAAAYTLFRVRNNTNMHMMMPPTYKDLWKGEFTSIKKAQEGEGRGDVRWLYAPDPFLAQQEREEAAKEKEKRSEQIKKQQAIKAEQASRLPPGVSEDAMKGWKTASKIEMGQRTRRDVERLIRLHGSWNTIGAKPIHSKAITDELTRLGFRRSHVDEAVGITSSKEEALEWLIIHVPEEDLPKWCFPEGYAAGVTFATGNIKRESAVKRLAETGYAPELCQEALEEERDDENEAAISLQRTLVGGAAPKDISSDGPSILGWQAGSTWAEEQEVLSSILEAKYARVSDRRCVLQIKIVGPSPIPAELTVICPHAYPREVPVLLLRGRLPAYIRLSIVRRVIEHATETLLGDHMIFNIVDWIEHEANAVIENPGPLADIASASSMAAPSTVSKRTRIKANNNMHPKALEIRPRTKKSLEMLDRWRQRQIDPRQQSMNTARQSLPAWRLRDRISEAVREHQVTIISGETGSGKSTQSVQFILDDMIQRELGESAKIICTQPRRISALGLADRVADERCSSVGQEVGYAIRGDSKQSSETRITFVTTGVLLRRLQTSGGSQEDLLRSVADISCIVVDEVHERSVDSDFLLCILRDLLERRKDLKLVLMSATLDADVFERYFTALGKVAKLEIEGRTHPVVDYFLDDVLKLTGFRREALAAADDYGDTPTAGLAGPKDAIGKRIQGLGMGINYDLIADLVQCIASQSETQDGAILIFLPGVAEIQRALTALASLPTVHALPLHAGLLPSEQKRVFPAAPRGKVKVIAATNVAETSITISDVVAVIDTGRVKETRYDPVSSVVKLEECWASRAACKQRRGRAGRVKAGTCYKLFTRAVEAQMAERPDPEIRRIPLQQLCLSVKAMGLADVPRFLADTLTPPDTLAVEGALSLLGRVGALESNQLTPLGQHMAMLPADLRCGKLMIYGALLGCFEVCVTVASILTMRSPFVAPQDKREEAKAARSAFAKGQGDIIADLNAYNEWSDAHMRPSEARAWCRENYLSLQTLNDIASTRSQYVSAMKDSGFIPASYSGKENHRLNRNGASSMPLLHALILTALQPNVARIVLPAQKFQASISGATAVDPEAREIRFFDAANARAFVHPSSTLFSAQSFHTGPAQAAFMSYWQKVETSKPFMRELSPAGVYAMCLFGGKVEVDAHGRGLLVDGWARVRGWARIGVLLGRVKAVMDDVLRRWIDDPGTLMGAGDDEDEVVRVIRKLVELEGLDN